MNYIIIKNITVTRVEQAVAQLADLYVDSGFTRSITISRFDVNCFLIEFPNNPDFISFAYYVNYLRYAEGFKNHHPVVYGVWNVSKPIEKIEATIGEKLLLYVSKFDREYDNVSIENVTGNTYEYSFTGKIIEKNKPEHNYSELIITPEDYEEYIEIIPSVEVPNREVKTWWKFW